jgi:hypothetical protein
MLGTTRLGQRSMLVRRLSPQEDKLDLGSLRSVDLEPLARYLGALAGAAHRRGEGDARGEPWTEAQRETIVDRAIVLAALHEGAYLAMCKATR